MRRAIEALLVLVLTTAGAHASESALDTLRVDIESVEVDPGGAAKPILTVRIENKGSTTVFLDMSRYAERVWTRHRKIEFLFGTARGRQTDHESQLCAPEESVVQVPPGKGFTKTIQLRKQMRLGEADVSVRIAIPTSSSQDLCKGWSERVLESRRTVAVTRRAATTGKPANQ